MTMQYRNSIDKLSNRSLKGTCEKTRRHKDTQIMLRAKPPLTPEKVGAIRKIYNQRIHTYAIESSDFNKRIADGNFNKHLASAIHNITRKKLARAADATNLLDVNYEN